MMLSQNLKKSYLKVSNMKIIMSVDRTECSTSVNAKHRSLFREFLNKSNLIYQLAKGVYLGDAEQSFVVELPADAIQEKADALKTIAVLFKQESILIVEEFGPSFLEYLDGRDSAYIGTYQLISKELAQESENYTQIGDNFYTCL